MEGYGQPAQGFGGDPYAAQAYGDGMGAYGALDPNAAAAGRGTPPEARTTGRIII